VEFALGFDIDGDVKTTRFWFYNCTATRPSTESNTNEDTKEPTTDTITVSASPLDNGNIRSKTTEDTSDAIYNAWYENVYIPNSKSEESEGNVSEGEAAGGGTE
jgi:hypothetical protein